MENEKKNAVVDNSYTEVAHKVQNEIRLCERLMEYLYCASD